MRPKLCTGLADVSYLAEADFARVGRDKLRLLAPLSKGPEHSRPGIGSAAAGASTAPRLAEFKRNEVLAR
jgi:hypothetical protein